MRNSVKHGVRLQSWRANTDLTGSSKRAPEHLRNRVRETDHHIVTVLLRKDSPPYYSTLFDGNAG